MFEGNSTVIVLLLCLFLMVEMGKGIEKEAFIDIATLKDLEIPWMWVASTAEEKAPQFVKVIDVIKKDVGKEKKDEVSIGPTSISQPRFIGNLKNKLCKVGLGIGCNLNFGMDKAAARPIIPQDINYVQPLVIQAVGRPIPAIPASDPNYGKADKKYKKNPQASSQPSFKPQTSQHIPGYNPVGQYSSPPLVASPPGEHLSQPGQEFSSGVPVPAPPNFKLPMHSFKVESPQHTLISMDPMTTFIAHPFNSYGNGLLSNGGNLISGGHVISAGNLINGGHTLNGGQLISNNQAVDGTILKSGQIITNGQTLDGNFVNGGHFISNGMLMNDNNFANSHIIRGGHIFSGNINGGSSVSNNANHINKNNINMKDFFSNKLAKSDLKNMINIPGNGFILQQPSSSNINKLDSNSFSVPVDFSFDQGFGTPQNFDTPQLQNGPQIFKAEFNAVGFPSSERPKKEAHFPFPHDQHQQHHQDQHQQHNPAPPTSSISHQNNPTQVVQHIHVHKHVHQMDDGSPDTLAKRIQGNLDIISTPGFGSGLRGSNVIREFLEQNEKPPFKRKVESTPKLPSKQSAANDDRCSCVRKDRCPVENVVETAAKEDISFMQDPRNKRSESKVLSTSASISTESNVSKSSDATTIPNEKKNLSTKPLNMLKFRKNLDALPKLLLNSKSQNLEGNSANKITGLNPLAERKILLNIKRHTKRDVSHLFNIDNNFSIKNISSSLGGDFPFKRQQSRSDLPFSCGLHEVCCNTDYVDFSLVGAPLTPSTGRSCGASTANVANGRIKTNIISEGEAKFGEFPWQAAILKKEGTDNVYICAGTVIDESHVLTAAHCVEGYKATQLRVRLGEWDVNRDTEFYPHIEYDAIGVAIHPDFFSGNLINDIALIRMLYPIDLDKNPHISPICLPATGSDYDGRRCWVSGWGKNGFGKNGKYQNLLKKVDVPVVSRQICQDILRETRLGPNYLLHKGMLCAGGEPEKDACKGDGGGPLSCPDIHGNFVLVGIVSWGIGCGQQGVPGVYTNVEYYRSWISKMIEAK